MNTKLTDGEVQVWSAWLQASDRRVARLSRILSDDERARAERFHFARDRDHYIVGRAVLRELLGRYLAVEPRAIVFAYEANGKPMLATPDDRFPLQFNVSHSHGLALYAFTLGRAIGVDVERMRPLSDMDDLAKLVFSPGELQAFRAAPRERRNSLFFQGWTLKEAFVKATGDGLSMPLEEIDIAIEPGAPPRLRSLAGDAAAAARWTLHEVTVPPGYAGAIAAAGPVSKLIRCQFRDDTGD